MQFLVHTSRNPDADPDRVAAGIDAEVRQVKAAYLHGAIRQIWHRTDRAGAVMLLELADISDVRDVLDSLPLVAAGAVVVDEVVPLAPYGGFAPA